MINPIGNELRVNKNSKNFPVKKNGIINNKNEFIPSFKARNKVNVNKNKLNAFFTGMMTSITSFILGIKNNKVEENPLQINSNTDSFASPEEKMLADIKQKDPDFYEEYSKMFLNEQLDELSKDYNLWEIQKGYKIKQENVYAYKLLTDPRLEPWDRYSKNSPMFSYYFELNLKDHCSENTLQALDKLSELKEEFGIKQDITLKLVFLYERYPEKVEKIIRNMKFFNGDTIAMILSKNGLVYDVLFSD